MRVIFTGGSGKAGRHILPYLASKGHEILNLDLVAYPTSSSLPHSFYTLKTDLRDSGQVFNALTCAFSPADFELPTSSIATASRVSADAIIHFAAVPRVMLVPDNETFATNVLSTYNVIEAACKLGIRKIIIASSETTYGSCFSQGDRALFPQFPLTEDLDVNPEDSYALSKLCGERTARTFARRFPGTDIYCLRIGNVIEPHEYERDFPRFLDRPEVRYRNAWSYVDARDLGQICHLGLLKSGLGWQVFNATNDEITTREDTKEVLERYAGSSEVKGELGKREAPLVNRKVREVLGFKEEHNWKKYLDQSALRGKKGSD